MLEHAIDLLGQNTTVLDYRSRSVIDAMQTEFLREELLIQFTKPVIADALILYAALKDERTSKLFLTKATVALPSAEVPLSKTAINQDDYNMKSQIFDVFRFKIQQSSNASVIYLSLNLLDHRYEGYIRRGIQLH
jgi:predicted membrane-bound spermidine synthase